MGGTRASANAKSGTRFLFPLGISLFVGILIGFYAREATDGFLTERGHEDEHARLRAGRMLPEDMPMQPAKQKLAKPKKKFKGPTAAMKATPKTNTAQSKSRLVTWEDARKECFQLASGSSGVFLSVRAEHRSWPACQAFAGNTQAFVSSFRIVDALNGQKNTVSFESCRHPGHYLRHNGANVVVEPPKVPDAAAWSVNHREGCIQLKSAGNTLRLDPHKGGRLDMAQGSATCLQMRRPPSQSQVPANACNPGNEGDAVKVASMADGGQPCQIIPLMTCPGEVPGASIGEHGLCNTKDFKRDRKEGTCLVYGIGISDNWDFEKAMAKMGCEVHAFDPTIDKPPSDESKRLPNLHFHRWGLAGKTEELGTHKVAGTKSGATETSQPMLTLDDMVQRLGHSNRRLTVFKIDCEGCEWAAMAAVSDSLWERIDQLSLELHYGTELMLDSRSQLHKAAAFADALYRHGFADYRSDVREGYAHHQQLLPDLYEAGMPSGYCCRLSGFVRQTAKDTKTPAIALPQKTQDTSLTFEEAQAGCFQLANKESEVRLSVRAEHRPWPASGAFAGVGHSFASLFKVVQAVSDGSSEFFSLESCRHSGLYLRHNGNGIVVETLKVPEDAVWKRPGNTQSDCIPLRSANCEGALRVDAVRAPAGRVEMDPQAGDENCIKMKRAPQNVLETDCSSSVSDAVKVASLADGQPCTLIPEMTCAKELSGSSIGEHGLCSTDQIEKDMEAGTCLVYGVGISDDWSFEKAMAEKGCEVHAFDPTIDKPPSDESETLPNLHFHQWGFAGETEETGTHKVAGTKSGATETSQPMLTLEAIMERLGHQSRRLSVFKVDCEGCEWAALAAVPSSLWDRIDQLSLELHYGRKLMLDSKEQLKKAASVVDALRTHGFRDWRSDWRDGYEEHRQLLPELYEAGMPHGFCCRLNGFVRMNS